MRRRGPLLAASLVVLLANAVALFHVFRNRGGEPAAELWLTERELPRAPGSDEDTGCFLRLAWQGSPAGQGSSVRPGVELPWFDQAKLEALGFDCSYPADGPQARDRYRLAAARPAYVVLEYDGPAWRRWLAGQGGAAARAEAAASRLVPVDVGLDPAALRHGYPDRGRCLVVAALVAPRWVEAGPAGRPVVAGRIAALRVPVVHVPSRLAGAVAAAPPRYEVLLRYGRRHEPWVVQVRPRS